MVHNNLVHKFLESTFIYKYRIEPSILDSNASVVQIIGPFWVDPLFGSLRIPRNHHMAVSLKPRVLLVSVLTT